MLHLKKLMREESFYLSLMFSMMLNTVCSRLVDQTDLIMMKHISENAAALICVPLLCSVLELTALSVLLRKSKN